MEIDHTKINKSNAAAGIQIQEGYREHLGNRYHYYNDNNELPAFISYRIGYYFNTDWQCHYIGKGKTIGCERHKQSQYYYNKSGNKFGEQIEWK